MSALDHLKIGEYERIKARRAYVDRLKPGRKTGKPQPLKMKPIFPRGRYVPASITEIITLVSKVGGLSFFAIVGEGHKRDVVHARFAIANLTEEFAPKFSCRAVEDAMNRGDGLCAWYRERHRDRMELYPEYISLYEDCRTVLLRKQEAPA